MLDDPSLLIERERAADYKKSLESKRDETEEDEADDKTGGDSDSNEDDAGGHGNDEDGGGGPRLVEKKEFYGTVDLNPVKAKLDFATIVDEVLEHFTAQAGVDVTILVEIRAETDAGFDESLQRTVKENCNVLKFGNAEFE
jgi:hypothetical protein